MHDPGRTPWHVLGVTDNDPLAADYIARTERYATLADVLAAEM